MAIFATSVVLSAAMLVLFETGIVAEGVYAALPGGQLEFAFAMVMEIATICLIPLALRLFKFKKVAESLKTVDGLRLWGTVRLAILCVPMVVNTLLYYLFMNVAFGYLAIILFLCLFFVMPTRQRCEAEMNTENKTLEN